MKGFLNALKFLTAIPIPRKSLDDNVAQALSYFPAAGLVLGLLLAGINQILAALQLHPFLINTILISSLIILTGGLHLDGLADTADAFFSGKGKTETLKIMRDPHIGTMGVLSLIIIILLKIGLLLSLPTAVKNVSLILMCLLSRYSLIWAMFIFPYAREEGKAKIFTTNINKKIFIQTTIFSLVCSLLILKTKGLILFFTILFFVFVLGKLLTKKIGGITGDTLGAINEMIEILTLLFIIIS